PNEILNKLINLETPEFMKNSITFEKNLCKEDYEIFLNEDLFKQMMLNLIQNSVSAMENTERPLLIMKSFRENDSFVITLEDNGCGMDKNTSARIFEPYFTTKPSGTGLGMTTVFKIVKEFNGRINVKSKVGKGTKFILIFPIPQKKVRLLT
ncbi:MAG: GHKL domain-containing protein, partial [Spirochaetaceae bacterium]|nr:GHKL domain-containing protein [Spirochaetaceae bacterium]